MELVVGQRLHGFTVQKCEPLPEIDGEACILVHDKSKARLLYLKNDDVNKSFSIAFRTPPENDTGVFHILEHSVLDGSDKFPVKEPFVNLLKSSMQTFLNALTFPDKTMYPVASTNDQDLLNLTDVYLDAVFHPSIYHKRAIFEQEGWHYELVEDAAGGADADEGEEPAAEGEGEAAPAKEPAAEEAPAGEAAAVPEEDRRRLFYNGVVYNEMKGALSDPDSVLLDELQAALFPDTAYRFESGGTPKGIVGLSYEQYLSEHARHYRTDNSYITLYGDLDLDAMLAFLDEKYLSPVADEQAARLAAGGEAALGPRELEVQAPVKVLGVRRPMVTAPENSCMALGYVVGQARERTRVVATDILLDAIAGSNEAPLKRSLLDAGLAGDVSVYLADGLLQPFAVISLRDLSEGARENFRPAVEEELSRLADGGLDHALVEASLSRAEFVMRERDYGMADGVALSMSALSGWLYDDDLATAYLRYEDDFAFLRGALDEGYFEDLIRSVFLENGHMAEVEIVPVESDEEEDGEEERLAAIAAAMDEDDIAQVKADEAELRRLQTEPDSPEALATLPSLSVADIGEAPEDPAFELREDAAAPILFHHVPTRNIVYTYRYFDLSRLSFEDLPYVKIASRVLGKLPTASHSASELDTLVNGRLGALSFFTEIYGDEDDSTRLEPKFVVGASALSENLDDLVDLTDEIMLTTDFSDTDKIKDVLQQMRIGMEQGFATEGQNYAIARVSSYVLPSGVMNSQMNGVDFYRFVKDLLANFDERAEALSARLADVTSRLFVDEGLTLSFTGSDADYARFCERGAGATGRHGAQEQLLELPSPVVRNEAFIVPADVCFVAQGADRRSLGVPYGGAWPVAGRVLSYDYLWNEIRVKGGAYGAGFQSRRTGISRFYSYRDPHLDETLERFAAAPEWLRSFEPSQTEMEGYIVSSAAGFDKPLKPRALARRQDGMYFNHRTDEQRRALRADMLATTPQSLSDLASAIEGIVAQHAICVFGNRDIIERSHAGLDVVDLLNE